MSYDTKSMKIGTYLVYKGFLNVKQAKTVLSEQNQMKGIKHRFGRIAIQKGYISENRLSEVMMTRYQSEI